MDEQQVTEQQKSQQTIEAQSEAVSEDMINAKPQMIKKPWTKQRWQQFGYQVSAIILALLLWVYVSANKNPLTEGMYTIPIEQRNLSSEFALMEQNYQVQIRVQGNSSEIETLSTRNFDAYVDLSGVIPGEATLQVNVDLPENVQLVSMTPESITVTIEKVVSKVFPVENKTIGTPDDAYSLLDAILTPSLITLSGPAEYMNQVGSVFVNADISGISTSYNQNLTVEVLDTSGKNISEWFTVSPSACNVIIPVAYSQPEKSVAVSAKLIGEPADGYQVSRIVVEPSIVTVLGSLDYLNDLYMVETTPIDISGLKQNVTKTVSLANNKNISFSVDAVTVAIQIEPMDTASFSRDNISINNLREQFTADIADMNVSVNVSGSIKSIKEINTTDIALYVDCSAISEPGEYSLPIMVSLPTNISLVSVDPVEVVVVVESVTDDAANSEGTEP